MPLQHPILTEKHARLINLKLFDLYLYGINRENDPLSEVQMQVLQLNQVNVPVGHIHSTIAVKHITHIAFIHPLNEGMRGKVVPNQIFSLCATPSYEATFYKRFV